MAAVMRFITALHRFGAPGRQAVSQCQAVGRATMLCSPTVVPVAPPAKYASVQIISRGVHAGTFKTRSSIKKRIRVKPNGTIVRNMSNRRHLNMAKSRKHVNRLGKLGVIATPGIRATYLKILKISPLKGR